MHNHVESLVRNQMTSDYERLVPKRAGRLTSLIGKTKKEAHIFDLLERG